MVLENRDIPSFQLISVLIEWFLILTVIFCWCSDFRVSGAANVERNLENPETCNNSFTQSLLPSVCLLDASVCMLAWCNCRNVWVLFWWREHLNLGKQKWVEPVVLSHDAVTVTVLYSPRSHQSVRCDIIMIIIVQWQCHLMCVMHHILLIDLKPQQCWKGWKKRNEFTDIHTQTVFMFFSFSFLWDCL